MGAGKRVTSHARRLGCGSLTASVPLDKRVTGMQPLINFLWDLGAWNWFIIAAVMGLLETIIPGVHFMWFGMAAIVMGIVGLMMPMPMPIQFVIFALISLSFILIARRFWSPSSLETDEPALNERGQQYVGRIVTVVEPIDRGRGKVEVGDTVWTAEGPDMPEGARAKVTGVKGTVLLVAPG
jgi:membrane protein implicated in regulation of membrane protease activity